jgi:hypothetical protein
VRVLVLASLAGVALTGCGGDSGSEPQTTLDGPASQGQAPGQGQRPGGEQFQAFQDCLREQGVELPDPGQGQPGGPGAGGFDPSDPDFRAAMEACQDDLPEGAGPGGGNFGPPPDGATPPDGSST